MSRNAFPKIEREYAEVLSQREMAAHELAAGYSREPRSDDE